MEVPTNPTRESAFVWICGSFLISANEIRVSREGFFGSGTETHGFRNRKLEVGSWKLDLFGGVFSKTDRARL